MSQRVAQILDAKRPSRTRLWKPVLGLSAGLFVLVFGAAPYAPRFVAFQNHPSRNQTQQIQARKEQSPLAAADAAMSGTVAAHVARESSLAPLRAVPVAFNPYTAAVPLQSKATSPRKPVIMRAKAAQEELLIQETFVILQTVQYDVSGSGVWTVCIWRLGGEHLADRQLESAVVLSSI
jgi:hypothetical protein